jgi:Rrf2 family protein
MGFISTGVEYGLHCLTYLVGEPHGARDASVHDLAELQGVPADFLAKVFTKLRRAGLVVASPGVRGGFSLARPAASISVLDVVEAIDGKRPMFRCNDIRRSCAIFDGEPPRWATRGVCSIHAVMLEAEKQMRRSLASHTLAELADTIGGKARRDYGDEIRGWLDTRAQGKVRQPG